MTEVVSSAAMIEFAIFIDEVIPEVNLAEYYSGLGKRFFTIPVICQ